jgi:hypothetical protein
LERHWNALTLAERRPAAHISTVEEVLMIARARRKAAAVPVTFLLLGAPAWAAPPPAGARSPAPVAPAVPRELCKGRSVLVFDDITLNRLAMDGLIADMELLTAGFKELAKSAPKASPAPEPGSLVEGLKAAGCTVEHWDEPLVSESVVDGKRTAFFGNERKEENYKSQRKVTDRELEAHHVVVWIRRSSIEKTKTRQGEGLRIDYKAEATVRARGRKDVEIDGSWEYVQDDTPSYAGVPSYSDQEAARKRAVEKYGPLRKEKEAQFDAAIREAVKAALQPLPAAAP